MKFTESHDYRLTKIVCTLGPASNTKEQILSLATAGMNVARINVSHGTREDHVRLLETIWSVNEQNTFEIATLIDTRGAEIRSGDVLHPISITEGDRVLFLSANSSAKTSQEDTVIHVGYDGFANDVVGIEKILVDNGEITFTVQSIQDGIVETIADQSGTVGSRRHINLPGADIDLPSITEKDWEDITFAAESNVDFVALSFIRNASEVQEVRDLITKKNSAMKIITKIETQQSVDNIQEIIQVSDGIMVARGDLGAEIPFEHLPVVQDSIVAQCRRLGKPVIVATHMLESMIQHPIPTRAEVTDVAHAAVTRADATMLSGETASGKHPSVAVSAMDKILRATETHQSGIPLEPICVHTEEDAYAQSAVSLAKTTNADAIFVFTKSGDTAKCVSMCRSNIPIIAFTPHASVLHGMILRYGITPVLLEFKSPEETVDAAIQLALKNNLISKGQSIVLVSDITSKDTVVSSVQHRML